MLMRYNDAYSAYCPGEVDANQTPIALSTKHELAMDTQNCTTYATRYHDAEAGSKMEVICVMRDARYMNAW